MGIEEAPDIEQQYPLPIEHCARWNQHGKYSVSIRYYESNEDNNWQEVAKQLANESNC